jgi:DNA-binding response OmpR family regulator
VRVRNAGGLVRVEVEDRGPGIADEFRARIFQKFSQADSSDDREKGGTGLGLSIAKAIVERLDGNIGFTSEPGMGSIFYFELAEWREPDAPDAAAAAACPVRRPRVMVVEDDRDIARLVAIMLERAGFEVDVAHDAARVRRRLVEASYDAMTVDLKLGDEDGIALIRELRHDALTRALPIVVVSASADEGRIQLNSQTLTVSDWLQKPIDENRLVQSLRAAVYGQDHGRPCILHVEDDPDVQRIAEAIARDFASFEFAATLAEAREQLAQRRFDLVLLDVGLPDGSGLDLVADLDRLQPRPPLVIFSADDVCAPDAVNAEAVLLKALTTNEQLLEAMQQALRR